MGGICKPCPPIDKEKACIAEGQDRGGAEQMIPDSRKPESKSGEPRNYSNPDPMNCGLEGKSLTVTLVNGRIESGKLMKAGQYFIEMAGSNGRSIIISKSAIITVSVL